MESSDAVLILHGRLEDRLKSLGLTPKQIEALTGDDLDPLVRSSFDIVRDTETLPLTAAIKQYLDLIEKNVTPRTWQLYEKQLKLFSEWAGRIQVTDIDRRLSSRYINECMIPKGLAPNTNINNVAALTAFFSWLIDNSLYEKANPFAGKGKTLKGSKQGNHFIANRAWTSDELKALFENTSRHRKGTVKYKAGIAARIALFSGMRQNEVCSIKLTDVNFEEGFIAIPKAKNENSVRQVPIHADIEPLIRDLVETSSDDFLIEGLPTGTRDKKRGHSLGNRFTDVKKEVFPNSAKNELTFHGLRSTFITAMEQAGIPQSTAHLIDGHARQSLSYGLYSKGPGLQTLADAMSKVRIQIG